MNLDSREITCKSALNKLKRKIPYGWDLNLYRGCEHACKYCFALYTHKYIGDDDYFGSVYVKTNIVETLEQELRKPSWKREVVNIGGITDSYQPMEARYNLMPEVLKLLIKYRTPAIISTKSDLILRDYDLIDQLSRVAYVNIAATITSMNEDIRKKIEPGGCDSIKRFEVLNAFRKTNATTGLHVMPIIPYLTDDTENMEALCHHGKEAQVTYMLPGMLYLRGKTRKVFFDFIQAEYPRLYQPLKTLYKTGGAPKEFKNEFYSKLNLLRNKYGLSGNYSSSMKEKLHSFEEKQLSLF